MPATVRIGFSKCGVTREQAAVHAANSGGNNQWGIRGTMRE
jgi:hypothetical protein